jgi:hypothetical protein
MEKHPLSGIWTADPLWLNQERAGLSHSGETDVLLISYFSLIERLIVFFSSYLISGYVYIDRYIFYFDIFWVNDVKYMNKL